MIFAKSDQVPYETTGGLDTVAVRIPSHPVALALIACAGGYVAAPSANLSGRPSPTLACHVIEDMNGRIEMIVDGGEVGVGVESTIVDMTQSPPVILRPGMITDKMLQQALHSSAQVKNAVESGPRHEAPKAPGMKYRHYAPQGEMTIVSGDSKEVVSYVNDRLMEQSKLGMKTGVICATQTQSLYKADVVISLGRREDTNQIAANLYRALRELDVEKVSVIFAESFEGEGLAEAIMNRMQKAAQNRWIRLPYHFEDGGNL
jgi:L-threonylcarbamoyladenylate synthase